jgi:16S rRNA (guanine527-N7)-methyltransferase
VAAGVFASALPQAEAYVARLAEAGTERGLIGPREAPRLWERHVLNCAVVTDLVGEGSTVCDVGSGAGLPGVVMAIRRPDLALTLVEPLLRRATFLQETVDDLSLRNVEVVRARAEQLHGSRRFDVVTSRAVAPLGKLLGWSLPLTHPGGQVLAMKGANAGAELEEARTSLPDVVVQLLSVGSDKLSVPTTVVRVEAGASTALRWGSSPGQASKRSR